MSSPAAEPGCPRVLGVDPGSRVTGWGLLVGLPARPRLVEHGSIRLGAGGSLASRLHRLQCEIERLVRRCCPTYAAVETPFHGANARSALQLAHARGVILAVLAGAGVPVAEYSPAMVKKAVTGNGRAHKAQVEAMVARLLDADSRPGGPDAADAVAVALCHVQTQGFGRAVARAVARR